MNSPKLFLFSLFLIFCLSLFMPFIQKADATVSYYNHIQNPSFLSSTNYIEDFSFESGEFNSGVTYGNWSSVQNAEISNAIQYSGVYALYLHGGTPYRSAQYNITYQDGLVLGADISSFTFYSYNYYLPDIYRITIYYSDASYDTDTFSVTGTWTQQDFTALIDTAKYFSYFTLNDTDTDASDSYFDDFILTVDDGGGQDEISMTTTPWFLGGTYTNNFGYINTVLGRIDDTSVQLSGYDSYKLIQNLNYVDSDYIQYLNLYIYGADVADGCGITVSVVYSDRTSSDKTKYVTGDGSSWEELNFGQSFIQANKFIIQIRINFESDSGTHTGINIDDVGLWLSVPYGFSHFSFTISPYPISITSFDFEAYTELDYTMNCYFYNTSTQTLNENGTYSISHAFGTESGNMINGFFSIILNERTYTASPYTLETITVTIITENEVFNVQLSAYWYPTISGTPDTEIDGDFMTNWFVIAIFLIVIPVGITASVTGVMSNANVQIHPTMLLTTFIASETLMGAIALSVNVINFWVMLCIIICDVLIILGLIRSNQ